MKVLYCLNKDLIIREEDLSVFSLENMEIYEFNKPGFLAILAIQVEDVQGITYDIWLEQVSKIPDIDIIDIKEFWDSLREYHIIEECK